MNTTAKIAAAVASGYLLGRTKKLRMAVIVGGLLAGKRIAMDPQAIAGQLTDLVERNPELSRLSDEVRGKLLHAGREAAVAAAGHGLNRVSDSIHDRTDRLLSGGSRAESDDEYDAEEPDEDEYEDDYEDEDDGEDVDTDEADDEADDTRERRRSGRKSTAASTSKRSGSTSHSRSTGRSTGRSDTRKRPAAKKATSSRRPTQKTTARKTAAKKSTAKKSSGSSRKRG
ncbi:hypothetical protein ACXJJ3_03215 [Kribbella sp. WER1]